MVRRSTPQRIIDDKSFPIRINIVVPPQGFGNRINDAMCWLQEQIGRGDFARHAGHSLGVDSSAFYFRTLDGARRFLAAFPDFQLADCTESTCYTAPGKVAPSNYF